MAEWTDRYWRSSDGIKLHYRDYAGPHDRPPILCLPGLTRNARDFAHVADRYAGEWRVLAVDLRGRGGSGFDPDAKNYAPQAYAADLLKLLDQLGIADAVFFGTSLGGLLTMLLAFTDGERVAGALLNDIGPVIERGGLEAIAQHVGKPFRQPSWADASRAIAGRNAAKFPRYDAARWDSFARRLCREDADGGIVYDYDPAIAENFHRALEAPPTDAWPLLDALRAVPTLILRGELSDLLSPATADEMVARLDDVELVTVPEVGHVPALDEPEAVAAIERLLRRILVRSAASTD